MDARFTVRTLAALGLVLLLMAATPAAGQCPHTWTPDLFANQQFSGPAIGTPVYAMAVWNDGTGPALYAGGSFQTAGGQIVNGIARWNGSAWSPLGAGCDNFVSAIAAFDDGSGPALFVAGAFTTAGGVPAAGIAKWNGQQWINIGDAGGSHAIVKTLLVFDDGSSPKLYAGGHFGPTMGGVAARHIARWNGTAWSAVGSELDLPVEKLIAFDDGSGTKLYAGGAFLGGVRRWNGTSWSMIGGGLGAWEDLEGFLQPRQVGVVYDLEVFQVNGAPSLFAGGSFSEANGQPGFNGVAAWNGTAWLSLGSGMGSPPYPPEVRSLVLLNEGPGAQLYAFGGFSQAGGVTVSGAARWTGTAWAAPLNPLDNWVRETVTFDDGGGAAQYACGYFTTIGGIAAPYLAWYRGGQWHTFASSTGLSGQSGAVLAATTFNPGSGNALYVAGDFTQAGTSPANSIARWNGTSWAALGDGLNGPAYAAAALDAGSGTALYVGGAFTTAGGAPANYIARWNGTSWSALGAGLPGEVWALEAFNDGGGVRLYAGGWFGVQRWDGSTWQETQNSHVTYALKVANIGGLKLFAAAGGVYQWDPSPAVGWQTIGSVSSLEALYSLEVFDAGSGPRLIAGGSFGHMNWTGGGAGVSTAKIAAWDGSAWTALGTGLSGPAWFTAATTLRAYDDGSGTKLYVGGYFDHAGACETVCLARWTGLDWEAMPGGGTNNLVTAITPFTDGLGPALYLGGYFTAAGGSNAAGIARWGFSPGIPGDLNGDDLVDGRDVQSFVTCTLSGGCACANVTVAEFVSYLLNG